MSSQTRLSLACALLVVAGCRGARSSSTDAAQRDARRHAARAADTSAGDAESRESLALAREALDLDCARCHAEIADEWDRSAHAQAFTNAVFRAEYDVDPSPFCSGCHAPLASGSAPRAGAARGVGCVLCHTPHDEQGVVTSVRSTSAPLSGLPTATSTAAVDLPATRACAECHDFPFEAQRMDAAYAPGQRLQRTVSEWLTSASHARGETCSSCHFQPHASRDGGVHTSHLLPGARDPATLAASLDVRVRATPEAGGVRVDVTLVSRAGHDVPTGDLYRALIVRAEDADQPTDARGLPRDDLAALGRHFDPSDAGLVEVFDDRVPGDGTPRSVALHLPPGTARVRWEIRWLALSERLAAQRGIPIGDVRREVASGVVAVSAPRSTD